MILLSWIIRSGRAEREKVNNQIKTLISLYRYSYQKMINITITILQTVSPSRRFLVLQLNIGNIEDYIYQLPILSKHL
jgi:hypothetical protein